MDFSLFGFQGLREYYNLHPIFIHFPIVLFPISFLFYLIAWKWRNVGALWAARLILLVAFGSAIAAAISGYLAGESIPHNETIHHIMQTHEKTGYLIVGVGGLLSLWSFFRKEGRPRLYPAFLGVLAALCLLIFLSADLGGRMVFIHGAGVKVAAPLMEEGHPEAPKAPPATDTDKKPEAPMGETAPEGGHRHDHHNHDHH